MFRSSPRRSQRSKGFKVKHAVQLCLLFVVGLWMVFQVRHSHEKKASYSKTIKTGNEVLKLGRKDPHHPVVEEVSVVDARHKEEEEGEEEESKHHEQQKLDEINTLDDDALLQKHAQNNEEVFGHTQDPINQERKNEEISENVTTDNESEHNEKFSEENDSRDRGKENEDVVEEKETEESHRENEETKETERGDNENEEIREKEHGEDSQQQDNVEDKEDNHETEKYEEHNKIMEQISSGDQVQEEEMSSEKAREEHYEGDNASSAVDHKTQDISDKVHNMTEQFEKESISNATESGTNEDTDSMVTINQGDGSENQTKMEYDSKKSSKVESDVQQKKQNKPTTDDVDPLDSPFKNGSDAASRTIDRHMKTFDDTNYKVEESILDNTTLTTENSEPDATEKKDDSTASSSLGTHDTDVASVEFKDSSSKLDHGEKHESISAKEGIEEKAWFSSINDTLDSNQEAQLTSSDTSSKQKSDRSSKSNFNGHHDDENIDQRRTNSDEKGSDNAYTSQEQANPSDTSYRQNKDESLISENKSDADKNNFNNDGEVNDKVNASQDVPISTSDSSNPRYKEASHEDKADAGQNENKSNDQRETHENEDGGQNEKEDAINSNDDSNVDSSIGDNVKEARMDLGTLPESITETNHHNDDTATER